MPDKTNRRKGAHLELCATGDVEPEGNDTLFGCVHLVHEALPELAERDVDTRTSFLGKTLSAPFVVSGMTGGTARAGALNRDLAAVAEELSIGFGVGSQRAMLEDPLAVGTFAVRPVAPRVALLGNIGLWQARAAGADGVRRLMDAIGADGMAVHLNAAQEMVQPEGDRDFSRGLSTLESLARALGERLVVKETGCGIGASTARRLADAGVRWIDVSGLGGTSWVRVEALRSKGAAQRMGESFSAWGVPTAASVVAVVRAAGDRARIIASGGIRDGLTAAKAIALGADLVGVALPVLRAYKSGGADGAKRAVEELVAGLRMAMALTGSRTLEELRRHSPVVAGALSEWIDGMREAPRRPASPEAGPARP